MLLSHKTLFRRLMALRPWMFRSLIASSVIPSFVMYIPRYLYLLKGFILCGVSSRIKSCYSPFMHIYSVYLRSLQDPIWYTLQLISGSYTPGLRSPGPKLLDRLQSSKYIKLCHLVGCPYLYTFVYMLSQCYSSLGLPRFCFVGCYRMPFLGPHIYSRCISC